MWVADLVFHGWLCARDGWTLYILAFCHLIIGLLPNRGASTTQTYDILRMSSGARANICLKLADINKKTLNLVHEETS